MGFDTDTPLTAATAAAMVMARGQFVLRYVSHTTPEPGDLTRAEVDLILRAGFGLMIVVHAPAPNWTPDALLGATHGYAASLNMAALGIGLGFSVWCDLEGVAVGTPPEEIIAYVNAWTAELLPYMPGLYVGYDCGLTAAQLYEDLSLTRYWKSASVVPVPTVRGFCMEQTLGPNVGGVSVDYDTVMTDYRGGLPRMLRA
jgi:Domain of unknown function (DUF1906)